MSTFLTVPTRGDHPELLAGLIHASSLPLENIVIVRTADVRVPKGVKVLDDSGPTNIHRWWNKGIEFAAEHGATNVAVLNDDLVVGRDSIGALTRMLTMTGATIATPGPEPRLHRTRFPLSPVLIGSLWVLNVHSGLRPDERFRWWYGDDDLDIRARRDFGGVATTPVWFAHPHASEATNSSPFLQDLVAQDARFFHKKHPLAYRWRLVDRKLGGRLRRNWVPAS